MIINLTISRAVQSAPAKAAMLVAGTTIPIRLKGEIDTKTANAGDTFQGTVSANVLSGATVALPTGTHP